MSSSIVPVYSVILFTDRIPVGVLDNADAEVYTVFATVIEAEL